MPFEPDDTDHHDAGRSEPRPLRRQLIAALEEPSGADGKTD